VGPWITVLPVDTNCMLDMCLAVPTNMHALLVAPQ
jgi:hypothetical protein